MRHNGFRKSLLRLSRLRGFSLVEIVLAIGIVSFAMVAILGLVPVGLNTYRDAMNFSVESAIAQRLAGDIQRTEFANQPATPSVFYFDDQGINAIEANAIFTADVIPPQSLFAGGILGANAPVRTVLIKIRNRTTPARTNSYSVIIQAP